MSLYMLAQASEPNTASMVVLIGTFGGLFVGLLLGAIGYWIVLKVRGGAAMVNAEKIKADALKEADQSLKESRLTAKTEALRIKEETDQEIKMRRKEQAGVERRLQQKEETLERKSNQLSEKLERLEGKEADLEAQKVKLAGRDEELHEVIVKQLSELERISSLDQVSAKEMLLEKLKGEVTQETGTVIRQILDEAKEKAEREAQKMLAYAMQRYAGECTYERTSATIPLPSDEMKGRIIGREGRNIRALESATGVSILIDDTPEAVVISCFDPVRKEIARMVIERLIADGRIHPARIEELLKKVRKEIDDSIYEAGEAAVMELGLQGIQSPLIRTLGRLKYRYSFSQNVLKHSIEAASFMGSIAAELGLDIQKAKRIGLLHDIGKAIDHEVEGSHAKIGADLLRKHGEAKDVINAVGAHHEEEEPQSVYATLIIACDALSASRPGARSESGELYLRRLEQLESIAKAKPGVENCFAIQAGRELRVVVEPEKINESQAQTLARDICTEIAEQVTYSGQIKVTIIRETRSVEYAK